MTDHMILIDVNGYPHELTPHQARMMMTVGWLAFLLSWIMNILFYATHPSAVDLSPKRLGEKCSIHILGKKIKLLGRKGSKFMVLILKSQRKSNSPSKLNNNCTIVSFDSLYFKFTYFPLFHSMHFRK